MTVVDFWISLDHRAPFDKERDSIALCFDGLQTAGLATPEMRKVYEDDTATITEIEGEYERGDYSRDTYDIVMEWQDEVTRRSNHELYVFAHDGDFHVCDAATYEEKYREFVEF